MSGRFRPFADFNDSDERRHDWTALSVILRKMDMAAENFLAGLLVVGALVFVMWMLYAMAKGVVGR